MSPKSVIFANLESQLFSSCFFFCGKECLDYCIEYFVASLAVFECCGNYTHVCVFLSRGGSRKNGEPYNGSNIPGELAAPVR